MMWQQLAPGATQVTKKYWPNEETVVGVGPQSELEHVIHEVAHAVTLGLTPFAKNTPKKIGLLLESRQDLGVENETLVWAIEWLVWEKLGMTFAWRDLKAAADVQGCDSDDIAAMVDAQGDYYDYIYDLSEQVIEEVKRFIEREGKT